MVRCKFFGNFFYPYYASSVRITIIIHLNYNIYITMMLLLIFIYGPMVHFANKQNWYSNYNFLRNFQNQHHAGAQICEEKKIFWGKNEK